MAAKSDDDLRRQSRGWAASRFPSSTWPARPGATQVHEAGSLRVRCPGAPAEELEAVIINTAGGIAGGDRFALDIAAGQGTRLVVTTAAAEKVYRTLGPDSVIDVKLDVAAGATLAWLPQETILFDRARLHAQHRGRSRAGRAAVPRRGDRVRPLRHGRGGGGGRAVRSLARAARRQAHLCGRRAARRADCAAPCRGRCRKGRHRGRDGADRARETTTRCRRCAPCKTSSPARSARRPGTASRPCACALPTGLRYATTSCML